MIEPLLERYRADEPLFVGDVRAHLSGSGSELAFVLTLIDGQAKKVGSIPVPSVETVDEEWQTILFDYIQAEIYNTLTTLGGSRLDLYLNHREDLRALVESVLASFETDVSRAQRRGVARVLNVSERMLDALATGGESHSDGRARFVINLHEGVAPRQPSAVRFSAQKSSVFTEVTTNLEGRTICGLDVGGTDIKAALVVNGVLVALKEHDWNPAVFTDVEQLIDPVVDTVRLLNAVAVLAERAGKGDDVSADQALCKSALSRECSAEELSRIVGSLDSKIAARRVVDGIGLSFPDVVVQNKVVGGEVPKTIGMRGNVDRDFEAQFAELTRLDERLQKLCRPDGVVMSTNDGPMAAFTAAVELAASAHAGSVSHGVFAHTLGTDLGTGLVLADGSIPQIPLEVYNMILDIGSRSARTLPAIDVRSLRNTNTNVAGTMQRFTSQTGAFRLAQRYFSGDSPQLLEAAADLGFLRVETVDGGSVTVVPEAPEDKRKAYLEYLMQLTESEPAAAAIFRDIGEFLALTWRETEHLLETGISSRFLFGRLVKVPQCFALMQEGAARREENLVLLAADSSMAFTPLMRQLDDLEEFTVAQFGQAIGAVYFANQALLKSRS